MSADPGYLYRVGRHLGRTIYRQTADGEELIGIMDTPELGALVVAALNALDGRHNACCSMSICQYDRDCPAYATCTLAPDPESSDGLPRWERELLDRQAARDAVAPASAGEPKATPTSDPQISAREDR